MQWSRLKKQVEALFADSVAGRVELRLANYRRAADWEGRGWITVDGAEVYNFCTHRYFVEQAALLRQFEREAPREPQANRVAATEAELLSRGIVPQKWFENSLEQYLSLPVEQAIDSSNFLHRALAVVDRRVGKRRLQTLPLTPDCA